MLKKMTIQELEENWTLSDYDELEYYINECECSVGDKAYLYSYEDDEITEMEIVHKICWSDNPDCYDKLLENEDVLIDGEDEYNADTSAEFITDNDSYLIWFKYI